MPLPTLQETPWYRDGLRFQCTGCGKCCTGEPGNVWVNDAEIKAMADHLSMPIPLFARKYLRKVNGRYSLVEVSKNYDCVFLKDNKCSIYQARPTQCKTFPWWVYNLKSKENWNQAKKGCEGIDYPGASLIDFETIEKERKRDEQNK